MSYDCLASPDPFLEVIVHEVEIDPSLTGLCAGFENNEWRCEQLASHLMEWLPEFALDWAELQELSSSNAVQLLRKAANIVYTTDKYSKRGEFGELLLHAAIRQVFDTIPAICKIYYKSSANETVKGFDAVHVVSTDEQLELWLGEAKFYSDINSAITEVIKELEQHTQNDYLRSEFILITNKINPSLPHYDKLKKLIHPNTSLDTIFERTCIPVLLTYNSKTVGSYPDNKDCYIDEFKKEIEHYYESFKEKLLSDSLTIHLFLVPMEHKGKLVAALNERLKACQSI
jgi:hypothetical protein